MSNQQPVQTKSCADFIVRANKSTTTTFLSHRLDKSKPASQQTHDAIITSLLRHNDVVLSFRRNHDVIITSCAIGMLFACSSGLIATPYKHSRSWLDLVCSSIMIYAEARLRRDMEIHLDQIKHPCLFNTAAGWTMTRATPWYNDGLSSMGIPIIDIRLLWDSLISIMAMPMLVRRYIFIETAPCVQRTIAFWVSNMLHLYNK